jgi:type I restriction enzyme S subunit
MPSRTDKWSQIRLGELVKPVVERVQPAAVSHLPFIGLQHVEPRTMRLLGTAESSSVKTSVFHFMAGDVLYGRLRPNLAKVVRPDFDGVCSAEFIVFRESKRLLGEFLKFLLASPRFTSFAVQRSTGDRPRVGLAELSTFLVRVPPLAEQDRISTLLRGYWIQLLAARDLISSLPERVAAYRQEVIASAFRGELSEDWRRSNRRLERAEEWARRIAKERGELTRTKPRDELDTATGRAVQPLVSGWTAKRLGELFDVQVGATPSRRNAAYWGGKIPWVSSGEIRFNRITSTRETITKLGFERSSTILHPVGTVLLAMIGEGKTRGQAAILDIEACNNQNSAAIRLGTSGVPSEFVFYFLWQNYEQTRQLAAGNSQPALNKARVMDIVLPLPPRSEAALIVSRIEGLLAPLAEVLQKAIDGQRMIEGLSSSLLDEALEGKLASQSTDVEAALASVADLLGPDLRDQLPMTARRQPMRRRAPQALTSDRSVPTFHTMREPSKEVLELTTALAEHGGELSPEQLFQAARYSPEQVEAFFTALRAVVRSGEVVEDRSIPGRVLLRKAVTV